MDSNKKKRKLSLKQALLYFVGLSAAVFVLFPVWDYGIARFVTHTVYVFDWRANLSDAFLYGAFGTMAIAFFNRQKEVTKEEYNQE